MTWKQELPSLTLIELSQNRTRIFENGTLQLMYSYFISLLINFNIVFIFRNIQKVDDGSVFVCIAHNEGGETQERVTIHIQGIVNMTFSLI